MKQVSNNIKGKKLSKRYDKFTRYRKELEHKTTSFSSAMDSTARTTKSGIARKTSTSDLPQRQRHEVTPRVARRSKKITLKQAQRLAKYAPLIQSAAKRHNVPVELICGVILQESGGKVRARSHCGARGLMQLMPATARRFGVKNSYDPAQNIEGGVKYLRFLLDRFDGNLELVLAGYNAGEGNVAKYGNKIPPFRETQNYVPAVLGYTQSMIDIFTASQPMLARTELPAHARRA
jgi:soluble lytic murein transglycosylase-like protein